MRYSFYLNLLVGTLLLSGCVATRLLSEDEYLLDQQRIKGTQKISKKALAAYYQQRPNTTWLGIPWRLWAYQVGRRSFDKEAIQQRIAQVEVQFSKKIALAAGNEQRIRRLEKKRTREIQAQKKLLQGGNLLMRWGEEPVIYSPQQRQLTEENLSKYLQSKGFFDAHVNSTVKISDQRATITYHVQENRPHLISALRLRTADQAIEKLLQAHQHQSLLKKGATYDQEVLEQERERIYELLSDCGYFDFNRGHIWFEVDKSVADNVVSIETVIGVPEDGQVHPVYHVGQVVWNVDVEQPEEAPQKALHYYRGIAFRNLPLQFKPHVLARKLPLRLPQLYRKEDMIEMQRRLAGLGMFKYIQITYDVVAPGHLVPHIYTTPVDRFQFTSELGLQVNRLLPTPFFRFSLASKSLFNRMETLELAAHVGVDGMTSTTTDRRFEGSQALGVDLSLSWPQFLLPLSDVRQARLERFSPRTSLSVGYDFTYRSAYTQDILKSFLRYAWQDLKYGTYEWTPFRLDVIATRSMDEEFKAYLQAQRNNLYRSFQPSWLTLSSFKTTFRKPSSFEGDSSWTLDLFLEGGGMLRNLIDLQRIVMPKLVYYQYLKLNCAYSRCMPVLSDAAFAYRVHTGIAWPYGEDKLLPYNRYYFLGGANDMRAWYPRSLGPGAYSASPGDHGKNRPEQPGEFLLQGSVELRQPIIGFLEGALFVDVGNTWALREDGRPGGKFDRDFYKAIAVGAGIGARLNFQFLVLRLDLGLKLYDPARPDGERFIGDKIALNKHLGLPGQAAFNFGIGYPF